MHSCIYRGSVRHRRFHPTPHAFSYSLFMMYLDLEELPSLFAGRWLWSSDHVALAQFRRTDHVGDPHVPLDATIRTLVEQRLGARPGGPIRLLTHLRYFGYCFNPVSFYFCFDERDEKIETIVAEITNPPWKERPASLLPVTRSVRNTRHGWQFQFDKQFHVPPFNPMDMRYNWR